MESVLRWLALLSLLSCAAPKPCPSRELCEPCDEPVCPDVFNPPPAIVEHRTIVHDTLPSYSPDLYQFFMHECLGTELASPAYCACAIDKLRTLKVPEDEVHRLVRARTAPSRMQESIAGCAALLKKDTPAERNKKKTAK